MSPILKIAGLSAVLAAGLVAAALPSGATQPPAKTLAPHLPAPLEARPSPNPGASDACARAVWPHLPRECLAETGRRVRTIAIAPRETPTPVRALPTRVAAR
jgi:hypothetical protein